MRPIDEYKSCHGAEREARRLRRPATKLTARFFRKGYIVKRIVQIAVVALSFSAGAAFAQQDQQMPKAADSTADTYISVAQASQNAEPMSLQREAPVVKARKPSLLEEIGLAGEGSFPSRGGPLDD